MSVDFIHTPRGIESSGDHQNPDQNHLEVPGMRFRDKIGHLFSRKAYSETNLTSVIETDFLDFDQNTVRNVAFGRNGGTLPPEDASGPCPQRRGSSGPAIHPQGPSPSPQATPLLRTQTSIDEQQCNSVAQVLHSKLQQTSTQARLSRYEIMLPVNLIERIAKDVVRMSCCEPNGLNGAVIHINLQRKQEKESFKLGSVHYDSATEPTFELHLTLIEDKKRWFHLKDLFSPLMPGCLSDHVRKEDIYISLGYLIEKKKLYTQRVQ